jgi:hypothetical protein
MSPRGKVGAEKVAEGESVAGEETLVRERSNSGPGEIPPGS